MSDREHWDRRWREKGIAPAEPSKLLSQVSSWIPTEGCAVDLAGGPGRNALWLAERGLDVTLVDVSAVALDLAHKHARDRGLSINTKQLDLTAEAPPAGPFDVALVFHFLHRPLLAKVESILRPGGRLVCVVATLRNLERFERPSRRFLLDEGEAPGLMGGLEIEVYREEWSIEGRHEAVVVARRP